MLLEVKRWPNPCLNTPCTPLSLSDIRTKEIQDLILAMKCFVDEAEGRVSGIAANQVGYNCQLAVIRAGGAIYEMINPRYVHLSDETFLSREGCFSLPFIARLLLVRRSMRVRLEASDRNGEHYELFSKDKLDAALLQHEMDHLGGILTINPRRRARFLANAMSGVVR